MTLRSHLPDRRLRRQRGFSLLEILVSLALFALLVGGMLGVAGGAMELEVEASEVHAIDTRRDAFHRHLEEAFRRLPQTGGMELRTDGSGALELVFSDHPDAFPRAGAVPAEVVVLRSYEEDNGKAVELQWLGPGERNSSVILFDALQQFQIRFFDPEADDWTDQWKTEGGVDDRRPLLAEIVFGGSGGSSERRVVWFPPAKPPARTR